MFSFNTHFVKLLTFQAAHFKYFVITLTDAPSTLRYAGEILKRSFISMVRLNIYSNQRNLKNALRLSVNGRHFENGTFQKRRHHRRKPYD